MKKYLIMKCYPLNDPYECEADREPVCITENIENFKKYGYEIYSIEKKGKLKKIQDFAEFD